MAQVESDNILLIAPKPIDDRTGVWVGGSWKLFTSVAEALADPDVISYRFPSMTIPIWDGINTAVEYWFEGGIANTDFKLKTKAGVAITRGRMEAEDTVLSIIWNSEIPSEGITYQQKHGDPDGVVVQVVSSSVGILNIYSPVHTWGFTFDDDPVSLIIDNGGVAIKYIILSKEQNITPEPIEGFWNDSQFWNDSESWVD